MASVIDIVMGLNHEAVDAGIDHVKEQVEELESSFKQGLTAFLSVEAIQELGEKTLEYGAKVKNLSEQYGITTDKLQETSNAAKLHDVDMEAVAQAYNKLIINQQKAIEGGTEQQAAFARMGISVDELVKMKPEELFDRVADATKNATDRGEAYGNVVAVMGKSAGSLMTTLEEGSAAIKENGQAMGVLSSDTIDSLDEANQHIKIFEQQVTTVAGTLIGWASRAASAMALPFTAAIGAGGAALELLKGHADRAREIIDNLNKTVKDTQEYIHTGKDPNAPKDNGPAIDPDREGVVNAAEAAKKKADEAHEKVAEKLAELAREGGEIQQQALLDQLPLYERIEAVKKRIADIKWGVDTLPDGKSKVEQIEEQEKMQRQLASLQGEATRKGMEDGEKAGDDAIKAFERLHEKELEAAKELSEKTEEYQNKLAEREKRADDEKFENRFRALKTESQQKEALMARQKQLEGELAKIPMVMADAVFSKMDEINAVKTRIADLDATKQVGGPSFKSDSLARIGGGGNVAGVSTMEKQLSEAKAQTALLQKLVNKSDSGGGNGLTLGQ